MRISATLIACLLAPVARAQGPVSFRNEIQPLLSRAGCNQGVCHGNLNGRGGFKLSLRGQDARYDHDALLRVQLGRRVDRAFPEQSLILLKATGQVPHEGGQRFPPDSSEYETFRRWIHQGAPIQIRNEPKLVRLDVSPKEIFLAPPAREVALKVQAYFDDGSRKDVADLAVFETTDNDIAVDAHGVVTSEQPAEATVIVRYQQKQTPVRVAFLADRPNFTWKPPASDHFIDQHVFARLKQLRVHPAEVADDAAFLRRVYLDLLGLLPTADEARRFLADRRDDKRARLIDELLDRPEFADCWALKWSDLLRNEEKQLDRKGSIAFHNWIRGWLHENKPLNEFAQALVASRGSTYLAPASNYYRALRDPHTRAEATAQVFLGIRVQCAKCHNHPYDRWTQNDYHQFAAFFPRVQYKIVDNNRKDKLDKHEFAGEQIVYFDTESELKHPVSGEPLRPKFLGGDLTKLAAKDDRLIPLADWIARPDNPFFARAQANRIWFFLMGRGIVEPEDDFRLANPPANGPLLEALAKDFVAHKFDVKAMIRTIANSKTYQLSSKPHETAIDDEANFARAYDRGLPAEPLLDAIAQITGVPTVFEDYPLGTRAGQLPSPAFPSRKEPLGDGMKFLKLFGKPDRLLNCACERSVDPNVNQALQLITGDVLNKALAKEDNRLGDMLKSGRSDSEHVDELFLATLSRYPRQAEKEFILRRVQGVADRRQAWEDVLWGLMNAKEFLLRR